MNWQYPEPTPLFEKGPVRSLTHLCLLKQSCGNHPSKSSLIALQCPLSQSCANIWPAIRPYLTSHLPKMFRTARRPLFVCNLNLYICHSLETLLAYWSGKSYLYTLDKHHCYINCEHCCTINLPHYLQEIPQLIKGIKFI